VNRRQAYEFIAAEKTRYPVRLLCRLLGVGHSAFYPWQRAGRIRVADRQRHDQHQAAIARQAWVEHRQVYGARRLTTELQERGHHHLFGPFVSPQPSLTNYGVATVPAAQHVGRGHRRGRHLRQGHPHL
jgi:hypothetical protein